MVTRKTRTENPVQTGPQPGIEAQISHVNPNAAESLADLGEMAADMDSGTTATGEAPGAAVELQKADTSVDDLTDVLKMVRDMAAPMVEGLGWMRDGQTAKIYTDARLKAIAGPGLEIMERNGVTLAETMDRFGPYLMLAVGLWVPGVETYRAVRENRAALASADDSQQQQQPA